jgi:hypothetical protein
MNMTLNLVGWLFYLIGMIWGTIREKKENQKIKDATSFLGEAIKTGDTEIYEDATFQLKKAQLDQIGPYSSYSIKTHFFTLGLGIFISNLILIFL